MKDLAKLSKKKFYLSLSTLFVLLLIAMIIAVWFGEESLKWYELFKTDSLDQKIFLSISLPRVLMGALVGFALSSSGVAFQSLLRNPLADPYILGVSGGAALGSALAIVLDMPFTLNSLLAFGGGVLSLFLIYWIAQEKGRLPVYRLLLTGVIFNSFCFSIIIFLNTLLEFKQSHEIWYIMVGSVERQNYSEIAVIALLICVGFFWMWRYAIPMNLIAVGEQDASYLGLDIERLRKIIFFSASLMVGATVSVAGLIGLLGLFAPHMIRLILGSDHRLLLPASGLFGASFLVLADWMARTLLSHENWQTQFPVGVITALVGGPFFVYLLKRSQRKGVWG